jgi:hypothetical protein
MIVPAIGDHCPNEHVRNWHIAIILCLPIEAMGSVINRTCGLKKFASPTPIIVMITPPNNGISMTPKNFLTTLLMPLSSPTVIFAPSILALRGSTGRRLFQLISKILSQVNIRDNIAGMQNPAESSMAALKDKIRGTGIT